MTGSLFRRLALGAILLIGVTLFAIDYTLTHSAAALSGAPEGPAALQLRERVLAISAGSLLLACLIAFLVSRSISLRIRHLKLLAESFPGGAGHDRPAEDSRHELASLEHSLAGIAIELQRLLDRLRYESARREAILSGMAEGVLAVNQDLKVTFCNTAFLRAIDYRGANFEGRSLLELIRDPGLRDLLRSVLKEGQPKSLRFKLSAANARVFEVNATPLEMPSGAGAIAILHDITDLERLEQVRKDFVANVSHELRTPLAGIIGYADTLLEGALQDLKNNHHFVEIIRGNAVRLNHIAADLLTLSELESNTDPPEPDVISVRAVLDAALATVAGEARSRGVSLIRESVDSVYVSGHRLRLEQALINLMANAVKFNRPGGEVRVRAAEDAGGVSITISDTGVGIPSQDLPRIFERFYRVDKARSRQVGGTGLGLSIVKHVVERMNGTVKVESQLGRGSTFTLLLRAADSVPSPEAISAD